MKKKVAMWCAVGCMFLLSLLSCADFDNKRCMQTVSTKYPNAKVIWLIPDQNFRFIVVEANNTVRYVTVMGSWDEITSDNIVSR